MTVPKRTNTDLRSPRSAPLDMQPDAFRRLGHDLVDRIADFLATLPERRVSPGESPSTVRAALGGGSLPANGTDPDRLLSEATELMLEHSLFNGHPRFWGYITSSAAPIGALGDLLASAVNGNVGHAALAPMAAEMEAQTVRWIAELMGYPADCDGLLVSGGNMANFVGLWAARYAAVGEGVRTRGTGAARGRLRVYASRETHTWLEKATDLSGLGNEAVRWIETDARLRMDVAQLRRRIRDDVAQGDVPFMVVGTAGSVSTGAVDPLPELAALCREHELWFHVDGAYGGVAAALPDAPPDLHGLAEADSVAVDPHKWLYAPLEAGCVLVRDGEALRRTFSYHPPYYPDDAASEEPPRMYSDYGPQNSRGNRALKVWLGLRSVGREGVVRMIADDIALARHLHGLVDAHPELEARTNDLSITTFRYRPAHLDPERDRERLNELNGALLERLQAGGEAYPSHAVLDGDFVLRVCIVNFRTSREDVEALPELVARVGRELVVETAGEGGDRGGR